MFKELGIPTPAFADIQSQADLDAAVASIGLPGVLKTRTLGYDGKGQKVLRSAADVVDAFAELGSVPCILEGFVSFTGEVSLVAVRGRNGEVRCYPLVHNTHVDGILRLSVASADHPLQALAEDYAGRVLQKLDYVGVLAFEFFEVDGGLKANEIAPRVHNSGHWTIEGAECSQFENHLRAVAGLPLGSTAKVGESAMLNFIGEVPAVEKVVAIPDCHLHHYGKAFKAGRKVGHATLRCADLPTLKARIAEVEALISRG
ncbi:N5-carboxyaminoimidazole ribonucleotide synthase [compost metagenome]